MYMLAGDMEMAGQERNKMNKVFRENGIRPVLSLFPALFQGVFFVSYFMAIRGMAYAPVTSMMAGGALWFPDLTMPDPSFILPIMSCAGFLISLEVWCVCVCVCMHACGRAHTYVCMYVFMYVCMYVCMYVRMYVCMYIRVSLRRRRGGAFAPPPPS